MATKSCIQCGKSFYNKNSGAKLCSFPCSVTWRKVNKTGHGESRMDGDLTTVPLYKSESVAIIDTEDAAAILAVNWSLAKEKKGRPYVRTSVRRDGRVVTIRLQRFIMERKLGRALLPAEIVDHKNRDTLDNTRGNLRLATSQQNRWNGDADRDNPHGFRGVYLRKNRPHSKLPFQAFITVNGKTDYLGSYPSAEEAGNAYRQASRQLHGEFSPFWEAGT